MGSHLEIISHKGGKSTGNPKSLFTFSTTLVVFRTTETKGEEGRSLSGTEGTHPPKISGVGRVRRGEEGG